MNGIKNIIFDLGNVIIDIDFDLTYRAFAELVGKPMDEVYAEMERLEVFDRVEKGHFTDLEFVQFLREKMAIEADDKTIIDAWNALLLDVPKERTELIFKLREKYNVYVLSNTSNPHIIEVNNILERQTGVKDVKDLCDKAFYSYEMGLRKPGTEIYEVALKEQGLVAEETLFLDDRLDNLQGAEAVGIKTIHVEAPKSIMDYLGGWV